MRLPLAFISIAAFALPVAADAQPNAQAEVYSQQYGVSQAEAEQRLGRLSDITRVERELASRFPNQFGGLFVEHRPTFRVVVKMTGNGQGLLRQVTSDPLFVVEQAERPVNQLMQMQQRVTRILQERGIGFESEPNVWTGQLDVRVVDFDGAQDALAELRRTETYVNLIRSPGLPHDAASIYGGLRGNATDGGLTCTIGFAVQRGTEQGVITAGHCGNVMTISGVTSVRVPTGGEAYRNSDTNGYDVQFMTATSQTWPNQIEYLTTYNTPSSRVVMPITQVYEGRTLQLGWPVCVYGSYTLVRRCGEIRSQATKVTSNTGIYGIFVRIDSTDGRPMAVNGDSGGPVFGQNVAYGIMKAVSSAMPNSVYFMSIGDASVLNVTVKTAP